MLDAEKRSVSIVIQIHELPSPPHEHGKAGGQDDPHRRFQTIQPVSNRTQGGLRPVERAHQCAHLAAPEKTESIATALMLPLLSMLGSAVSDVGRVAYPREKSRPATPSLFAFRPGIALACARGDAEISNSAGSSRYERIEARLQCGGTVNPTRPLSTDMNHL